MRTGEKMGVQWSFKRIGLWSPDGEVMKYEVTIGDTTGIFAARKDELMRTRVRAMIGDSRKKQ